MAASDLIRLDHHSEAPRQIDLDKCVHCGLCLNSCPTYRELGVEMDSPRGRIYQMAQVVEGKTPISETYIEHMELCLACRGCERSRCGCRGGHGCRRHGIERDGNWDHFAGVSDLQALQNFARFIARR